MQLNLINVFLITHGGFIQKFKGEFKLICLRANNRGPDSESEPKNN